MFVQLSKRINKESELSMNIDLVSVYVGVVSSAVIPFVTWTIRKYNNHSKYKSFKNLLLKE